MRLTTRELAGVVAITAALIQPAVGAEITRRVVGGVNVINIAGIIELDDDSKFFKAAGKTRRALVVLASPGGHSRIAGYIAYSIRREGYHTAVFGRCDSACVLIWLGGFRRHLDPQAKLGVHADRNEREAWERNEYGTRLTGWLMSELGAPQALVDLMTATDPNDMSYVDHAKAAEWGLLSRSALAERYLGSSVGR